MSDYCERGVNSKMVLTPTKKAWHESAGFYFFSRSLEVRPDRTERDSQGNLLTLTEKF